MTALRAIAPPHHPLNRYAVTGGALRRVLVESPYDCPSSEAFRVAAVVHPYWESCKNAAQSLLARNTHQILGPDLRSPVDFVVCWTPDGCETEAQRSPKTGGTGQAIALASRWGIPVYNLLHGQKALDRLTLQVKSIN